MPPLSGAGRQLLAEAADALLARLDEIVAEVDAALESDVSEVADLADELRDDLHRSTRAQLSLAFSMLRSWGDPWQAANAREALDLVHDLVRAGLAIDALLRLYRRGHWITWNLVQDELRKRAPNPELLFEASSAASAFMFAYVDTITQPLIDDFVSERERLARRAETSRSEEVRRILGSENVDVQQASARLRYELRRWHVAFVAWAPATSDEDDARPRLEAAGSALAKALGVEQRVLTIPGARLSVHGWIGAHSRLDWPPSPPRIPGLHVAFGDPGEGLDGFRESHAQALAARRVARLSGRRPGSSVVYRDVAVAALLTADVAHARRFVTQVLGPLAADNDSARRLVTTLEIFHEEACNFVQTGRRLHVHENTVAYRVHRALELTGEDDATSLKLRTAVLLASVLGAAADELDEDRASAGRLDGS